LTALAAGDSTTCTGVENSSLIGDIGQKTVIVDNTGVINGAIILGVDDDALFNIGGQINNDIHLGEGADDVVNTGTGLITGNVTLGDGSDVVTNDGVIEGSVDLGSVATGTFDTLINSTSGRIGEVVAPLVLQTLIVGTSGSQNVNNDGTVNGHIDLGDGDDILTNNNAATAGNILMGDGADTVDFVGGANFLIGGLDLGTGGDTLEVTGDNVNITGGVVAGNDGTIDTVVLRGTGDFATLGTSANGTLDVADGFEALAVDTAGIWTVTNTLNLTYDDYVTVRGGTLVNEGVINTGDIVTEAGGTLSSSGNLIFSAGLTNDGTISSGTITGDASDNTLSNNGTIAAGVVINMGAGADIFTNSGTMDGVVNLEGDDDSFIFNGTVFNGQVDGGIENVADTLVVNGALNGGGVVDNANFTGFEALDVQMGQWSLSGVQTFSGGTSVSAGHLIIDGTITSDVNLDSDTELTVNGTLVGDTVGTAGIQTVSANGTITGGIDFGAGNDIFNLNVGSSVTGLVDGGADTDTLNLTGAGTSTLTTNIVNFETLNASGSGTWILNNDYTFTGGVNVNSGTLQVDQTLTSNVTIGSSGTFTGNGSVVGNIDNSGTFSATITGGSGSNTFTNQAGATISAGAVIDLGDGSDTFINLGILDGTVNLGAGDDTQYYDTSSPVINGTISGGTNINGDTLILTGTGSGNTSSTTFSGFEILNVTLGNWTIDDSMTFASGVNVNAGVLNTNGTLTADVAIADGAILTGGPQINGNVTNNGLIQPGGVGTVGSLDITGDFTQSNTGSIVVDVNAGGGDVITVDGTANIDGSLVVTPDGTLVFGQVVQIVSATGGVNGTFDSVTSTEPIILAIDYTDPNAVSIIVSANFVAVAGGAGMAPNQISVADNFTSLGGFPLTADLSGASAILNNLMLTDLTLYAQALDSLHPEFYDAGTQATLNNSQRFNGNMRLAMMSCDVHERSLTDPILPCNNREPGTGSIWISQSGSFLDHEAPSGHITYDATGWSTQIGTDSQLTDMVRIGGGFGYNHTDTEILRQGDADLGSWDAGLYGRLDLIDFGGARVFLGGMGSYSLGNHESKRTLAPFGETAVGNYDSERMTFSLLAGMAGEYRGIEYGGSVGYRAGETDVDGFTETGAGGLGLIVDSQSFEHDAIFAEFSLAQRVRLSDQSYLTPQIGIGYEARGGILTEFSALALSTLLLACPTFL
jgi:autotransporter-associated beta strand protein